MKKKDNFPIQFSMIKLLIKCKKSVPNSEAYFLLFFLLKFLGALVISHNDIDASNNSETVNFSLLRYITYFNKLVTVGLSLIDYNAMCFIIYIFINFPIILIFITLRKFKQVNQNHEKKLKPYDKILIKISSILITALVLLSQHLIEILSFIFINSYIQTINVSTGNVTSEIKLEVLANFQIFNNSLILPSYVFCTLNAIFILILNILVYYYITLMNEPLFSSNSPLKFLPNKKSIIALIILFNMQALHYIDSIYTGKSKEMVFLIMIILCIVIVLYNLITQSRFVFVNIVNVFVIFLTFVIFFSGIFSIIRHFTYDGQILAKTQLVTQILEIIIAIIFSIGYVYFVNRSALDDISVNIFKKNKKMKENSLYAITLQLYKSIFDSKNFSQIFQVISKHSIKCTNMECPCKEFKIDNFYEGFKELRKITILQENILVRKFKSLFFNLLLLIEAEVCESIHHLYKNNNFTENYQILLLHIDFNFFFKTNAEFGLFLLNGYRKIKDLPFIFYFTLFNLEYNIVKSEKSYSQENKKVNAPYEKFFKYSKMLEYLNSILIKNVENFEKLIHFKNEFNSALESKKYNLDEDTTYKSNKDLQIETLLDECMSLQKNDRKLSDVLEKNFSQYSLKNAEMCYLINNFYIITNREVPIELENNFIPLESYSVLLGLETSYEESNMRHPVIVSLDQKSFKMTYVSQKLCDRLGYKMHELLKGDLHMLMPESFAKEHKILMKKFILLENNHFLAKTTFILTKDKFYFPVKINLSVIPTFLNNTLIIDFRPIEKTVDKHSYYVLLDRKFNLIAFDREYSNSFSLSYEIYDKLKISFLNLYSINEESLSTIFKTPLVNMMKEDYSDLERATKLYNNLNYSKSVSLYNLSSTPLEKKAIKQNKKKFIKKKKALIPYLSKLESVIKESEYDKDWLMRIQNLQKKFNNSFLGNKLIKEFSRKTSKIKGLIDSFVLKIYLKNIANIPYYFIKIYDSDEVNDYNIYDDDTNNSILNSNITNGSFVGSKNKESSNSLRELPLLSPMALIESSTRQELLGQKLTMQKNFISSLFAITSQKDLTDVSSVLNNNSTNLKDSSVNINNSVIGDTSFNTLINTNQKQIKSKLKQPQDDFSDSSSSIFQLIDGKTRIRKLKVSNKKQRMEFKRSRDKWLSFLLLSCLVALVVMAIYNVFFTTQILNISLNTFYINYYTMIVKSTIYSTASAVMSSCFKVAGLEPETVDTFTSTIDDYSFRLNLRGGELYRSWYQLKYYLAISKDVPGVNAINEVLYKHEPYNLITDMWVKYSRNSTIVDELDYYHYYISQLQNPGQWDVHGCNVNKIEDQNFNSSNDKEASFGEMSSYYAIYNVFYTMRIRFIYLNDLSLQLIEDFHLGAEFSIILYNSLTLLIYLCLALLILISIIIYRNKIVDSFNQLVKQRTGDIYFQKKLANLKSILLCFDQKKVESFEIQKVKLETEWSDKVSQEKEKINVTKDKKFHKDALEITHQPIENLKHNFRINLVNSSIWLIFIAMGVYMIIISLNVTLNISSFKQIVFANNMIYYFLGRTTRMSCMLLYYKISMIMHNPNFLSTKIENYESKTEKGNYFNLEVNTSTDSFYSSLNDSEFAYIYYMFKIERNTIKTFMDGPYDDVLPIMRKLEKLFNTPQICPTMAEYFLKYMNNTPLRAKSLLESFELMTKYANECRRVGQGINSNGLSTALDNVATTISNLYLDYVKTDLKDSKPYLIDLNYIRALHNNEYVLLKVLNVFMVYSLEDMKNLFDTIFKNEVIYSSVKLIWVFLFIMYFMLYVLLKLQKYTQNLSLTIKRIKHASTFEN